jgi:hypothetical protein
MAEHRHDDPGCLTKNRQADHCLPYRLAEEVERLTRELAEARKTARDDAERMLALLLNPTMDVGERLVAARRACRAALGAADQPTDSSASSAETRVFASGTMHGGSANREPGGEPSPRLDVEDFPPPPPPYFPLEPGEEGGGDR